MRGFLFSSPLYALVKKSDTLPKGHTLEMQSIPNKRMSKNFRHEYPYRSFRIVTAGNKTYRQISVGERNRGKRSSHSYNGRLTIKICKCTFSLHCARALSGPGPPHYRGFTITLRHTTLGRTPLDKCSALGTDLYLTTHNTHKRETSMLPERFEPAGKVPGTH
jgi:hypothetical protein